MPLPPLRKGWPPFAFGSFANSTPRRRSAATQSAARAGAFRCAMNHAGFPGERWQRHARRGHPRPRVASALAKSSAEGANRIASRRDRPRAWSSSRIECKDQSCADSGAAFVQAAAFETSMAAGPRWSRTPVPFEAWSVSGCQGGRLNGAALNGSPPSTKTRTGSHCLHPIFLPRPATRVGCCGSAYFQKSRPGSRRKRTDASCGSGSIYDNLPIVQAL